MKYLRLFLLSFLLIGLYPQTGKTQAVVCGTSNLQGGEACVAPETVTPGFEICNNCIDDDGDGLIDCADRDCLFSKRGGAPRCSDGGSFDCPLVENCGDQVDNNLDGQIDENCAGEQNNLSPNDISGNGNNGGSNLIGSSCNLAPLASSTGMGWLLMLGTPLAALFKKRLSK